MNHLVAATRFKLKFIKIINTYSHIMFNKFHINLVTKRNGSQFVSDYHKEIEAALNDQIKHEHQAAINYLKMAVYFLHADVSCNGAGRYFMEMYKEETNHMEKLINYQLKRGGMPILNTEKESNGTPKEDLTMVAAFTQALNMEKTITEQLRNIVSTAEAIKDYHCADFLTSKFLDEQVNAIHELTHHVTVLNKLCDSEQALWLYDQHLLNLCSKS